MAGRNFRRRSFSGRRRTRKLIWIRGDFSDIAVASTGVFDLLADFRTLSGITINLPGFTIKGLRIRISVRIDTTVALDAGMGITTGAFVQDFNNTPASDPQGEKQLDYMLWQWNPYAMGAQALSGVGGDRIFAFDVSSKAQRRMEEVGDTLWFSWATTGAHSVEAIAAEWSIPILLP